MKVYQFRVSIIGIPKVYRIMEVSENCTFEDFHEAIFDAFDRYDPHLYSFFLTGDDTNSRHIILNSHEITHIENMMDDGWGNEKKREPANEVKIGDAEFEPDEVFHYWFDFGDDWWHRIRVQSVKESNTSNKAITIVKSFGESPPQYPDYEDFDEEDEY